jgi:hypothetical protein
VWFGAFARGAPPVEDAIPLVLVHRSEHTDRRHDLQRVVPARLYLDAAAADSLGHLALSLVPTFGEEVLVDNGDIHLPAGGIPEVWFMVGERLGHHQPLQLSRSSYATALEHVRLFFG